MKSKGIVDFSSINVLKSYYIIGQEYIKQGDYAEKKGHYQEALHSFESALACFCELYDITLNRDLLREISILLNQIGHEYALSEKYQSALLLYKESASIRQIICHDNPTIESILDLSFCYDRIGRMQEKVSNYSEAVRNYSRSLRHANRVKGSFSKDEYDHLYCSLCNRKANAFFQKGDCSKALKLYYESYKICRNKYNQDDSDMNTHDLYVCVINIAEYMMSFDDIEDALVWLNYGKELIRNYEDSNENEKLKDYAYCCMCMSIAYAKKSDSKKALDYSKKNVRIHKKIMQNDEQLKHKLHYSAALDTVGEVYFLLNDLENAAIQHKKNLDYNLNLLGIVKTVETLRNVSINYDRLGDIQNAEGDKTKAEQYYLKAVEYDEIKNRLFPSDESFKDLAYSYNKLYLNNEEKYSGLYEEVKEINKLLTRKIK